MTTPEAIKIIQDADNIDAPQLFAAAKQVTSDYIVLAGNFEQAGARLLTEMQNAADWEAVSKSLIHLLKNRKAAGWEEMVDATVKQLEKA